MMEKLTVKSFRDNMKLIMSRNQITYEELERRTGIGKGSLNEYVHGKHRMPLDNAITIAMALGSSIDEMLTPSKEMVSSGKNR